MKVQKGINVTTSCFDQVDAGIATTVDHSSAVVK